MAFGATVARRVVHPLVFRTGTKDEVAYADVAITANGRGGGVSQQLPADKMSEDGGRRVWSMVWREGGDESDAKWDEVVLN